MKPIELWHGDCLDMLGKVDAGSVRMAFCDLPYGVTSNRWDTPIDLAAFWPAMWRAMMPNGVIICTGTQPFTTTLISSQPKHFRYTCIWDKVRSSRFMMAKKMPLCQHEDVLFFYRKPPLYIPQMVKRDKPLLIVSSGKGSQNYGANHRSVAGRRVLTVKYPTTILTHRKDKWAVHPTQKPVSLLMHLINTYSNPGDTILDPTMGSGTTCIAAHYTGRHVIGIEKSHDYYKVALGRVRKALVTPKPTSTSAPLVKPVMAKKPKPLHYTLPMFA